MGLQFVERLVRVGQTRLVRKLGELGGGQLVGGRHLLDGLVDEVLHLRAVRAQLLGLGPVVHRRAGDRAVDADGQTVLVGELLSLAHGAVSGLDGGGHAVGDHVDGEQDVVSHLELVGQLLELARGGPADLVGPILGEGFDPVVTKVLRSGQRVPGQGVPFTRSRLPLARTRVVDAFIRNHAYAFRRSSTAARSRASASRSAPRWPLAESLNFALRSPICLVRAHHVFLPVQGTHLKLDGAQPAVAVVGRVHLVTGVECMVQALHGIARQGLRVVSGAVHAFVLDVDVRAAPATAVRGGQLIEPHLC
ncbi:hypothetical protein ACFWVU_00585 [Streptomyces sp. NPDC058686]|uniref:hypothetical protein n=1 Tax=Streptomyces sp. NPDC058686 TaxID=3346599 RepID=UPI00365DDEA4